MQEVSGSIPLGSTIKLSELVRLRQKGRVTASIFS